MKENQLTKIREAVKLAFSASTASRVISDIENGTILSAGKVKLFKMIYKATKKTPNDLIDYKGDS